MGIYNTQVNEQLPLTSNQPKISNIPATGKIQSMVLQFYDASNNPVAHSDIASEIGNISLKLNGKDVVNVDASTLVTLYKSLGRRVFSDQGIDGSLELNIGRLLYIDPSLRDVFGFGTADISSITVQVTPKTLTNIKSFQVVTERSSVNEVLGTYCEILSHNIPFSSVGTSEVSTLPRVTNSDYLAIINDNAGGFIQKCEVKVNSITLYDPTPREANGLMVSNKGYHQPDGFFNVMFCDGTIKGRVPMSGVTDLRVKNTFTIAPTAGNYDITTIAAINLPRG